MEKDLATMDKNNAKDAKAGEVVDPKVAAIEAKKETKEAKKEAKEEAREEK